MKDLFHIWNRKHFEKTKQFMTQNNEISSMLRHMNLKQDNKTCFFVAIQDKSKISRKREKVLKEILEQWV